MSLSLSRLVATYDKNNLPSNLFKSLRTSGEKRIVLVGSASMFLLAHVQNSRILKSQSFRILITGNNSGLVETITDAVSIHSIKKAEYARRIAEGRFDHVTLFDHFTSVGRITLTRVNNYTHTLSDIR